MRAEHGGSVVGGAGGGGEGKIGSPTVTAVRLTSIDHPQIEHKFSYQENTSCLLSKRNEEKLKSRKMKR